MFPPVASGALSCIVADMGSQTVEHTYGDRNEDPDSNSSSYSDSCLTVVVRRE
jgi:hypothetical protein